jgi:nucleoside-diphosphate-sugar epimerase
MRIAVTGAYGFSGKYIARRLLDLEHQVITLPNSPHRGNPFGESSRHFLIISQSRANSKTRFMALTF